MIIKLKIEPIAIRSLPEVFGMNHMHAVAQFTVGLFIGTIEKKVGTIITAMLRDEGIPATVSKVSLQFDESGNYIGGVLCYVSEIDYGRLVMNQSSRLESKLTDEKTRRAVSDILSIISIDGEKLVRNAVGTLGERKTILILRVLLAAYQDTVCRAINQMMREKGFPITVTAIEIEQ